MWRLSPLAGLAIAAAGLEADFRSKREAFIIGDLHADLHCAQEWVRRSGLVDLDASPWAWTGSEDQALAFLGDYVDKGWQGRQVMEFVRNLTSSFPRHVLAMLGNHDLYLLFDTLFEDGATQLMGFPVRDFAYAFTHPEEYLNWIPAGQGAANDTAVLLPALFQALDFVYEKMADHEFMLGATPRGKDLFAHAPPFREDPGLAVAVQELLRRWQASMAQGLVDSGLAAWLSERPLVASIGGALLTHGGVPPKMLKVLRERQQTGSLYPALENATTMAFRRLWQGRVSTPGGVRGRLADLLGSRESAELIDEVVNYRGLHKSCKEVHSVLKLLAPDIEMIVVGHTPKDSVRLICEGRHAALDSTLSRFFRAHGNRYCPARTRDEAWDRRVANSDCKRQVPEQCAGQAGLLSQVDGRWVVRPVNLIHQADAPQVVDPEVVGDPQVVGGSSLRQRLPLLAVWLAVAVLSVVRMVRARRRDAPDAHSKAD